MDGSTKWRLGLAVAALLAAIYALVPTWTYFRLPPDVRNDREAFEHVLPDWAPTKKLQLGLDLLGGIHLALGIEVEKAVDHRLDARSEEIKSFLTEKKVEVEKVSSDHAGRRVLVKVKGGAAGASDQLEDWFQDMRAGPSVDGALSFHFPESELKIVRNNAVEQSLRSIRNRVDKWGVAEPVIARRGDDKIIVQLPGFKDPQRAKDLLGRTAQLEFRIVDDENQTALAELSLPEGVERGNDGSPYLKSKDLALLQSTIAGKAPEDREFGFGRMTTAPGQDPEYRTYLLDKKVPLTGQHVTDARAAVDQSGGTNAGKPYVSLTFGGEGARLFEELTGANIKKRLAIVLDGMVDSAPVIQSKIPGGRAQITLGGMKNYNEILQEANDLSLVLKAGALPAPVSVLEERTVGSSLGPDLIRRGALALMVGSVLVLAFMALWYKTTGLIVDVTLVLNVLVLGAIMSGFGATLTLPGLAGILLTVGMAADANILINERIREELAGGKVVHAAVQAGYEKAFWTIFDANVTTLIAGFVLLQYGTGPVRGFAVTLIVGILSTLFTSLVCSRALVEWLAQKSPRAITL